MDRSAADVWNNGKIPVALRRTGKGERIRVRLPYSTDNRRWLVNGRRNDTSYNRDRACWELPKAWFDDFVDRALERYEQVWIIQPFHEQERCSPSCRNARGHECECSCMGQHHGMGDGEGWFDVSETFSVRWGPKVVACRLLTKRDRFSCR